MTIQSGATEEPTNPSDDVVEVVSKLIRFDTTNTGEPETTKGEAECAQWVAEQLAEVGYAPQYVESGAPGRGNVFVRLPGADPSRGGLLIHGHLDVVPAEPTEWSVHPFSGAVKDGFVWGRGAIDMKDMVGMMIVVARQLKRAGIVPPRDLVFAFIADEEHGGTFGAQWLVDNRPDLFDGVTEAIGEVGGFSLTVPRRDGGERRLYLIETAEKGLSWMRLTARGPAGHGSMVHDQNAVTAVAEAVARLGRHQFPLVLTDTVAQFLAAVSEETGLTFDTESGDLRGAVEKLGPMARMLKAVLHDTANPTMLKAGYKANVVPAIAEAVVDCRILPGRKGAFEAEIDELLGPDVTREWIKDFSSYETSFDGDLVDAMNAAVLALDPDARTVPYMLSGGTDAKSFARLGIRCFGFSPLRLPPDLDFTALFHGVDERVPIDALRFGTDVLTHFLTHC
ncbi:M20/M25/M40 family metallo-hydrolase [Mycobacterium intracellulare]|uniref:M20/M25/M40 family metallo-hydrolase n=1 Tax=Mycobacterium intracellulare TaxID=1767 RepID=A0AAE4RKX9_MYCIT|nr:MULTISPECIES: M20/M25/M40 family metallo-hydrolase [Mycobacterium avium complex (MAC)]ETZ30008.1 peptidase M20/M25/M40 family protein [Mycobacterium intracellulare MIN_052511_1280]MCA2322694.1 M20/M25/M40 family metallo-hydrolase [Mycobacterium intracellulare]MCA2343722.1 M20/M25/M40 family metallo-hydrolase [Mycobacterium intracellulare]MDV6975599.1 M20/M25/M40 family metallo-hydrolase [Mycobacterium intracellulare]MDV6985623.1 M20/M25/M40 family metallo-hydrolase [Mycobacterium intracellu